MSPELAVQLIGDAVITIIKILLVLIVPGLLVGVVVAIIQTATSVQEQTLTFLPRMLITLLMLIFAGHWIIESLTDWFARLSQLIPGVFG
ncbi:MULTISPECIES: flagellar biosynthetic protein FliQ [Shewanella]|uniref:Flagellar biosynthetic protein FliQ n=1 Tax=Shewanella fodinae TaxID=552357 RepID=A0A4R2FBV4_9GAMM|nr:flagellar biosynthetic protein FliQ [Shewanella fodinae]MBO1272165.1 flagellar type III secretion system protein FliQ [Shewanella sp. 4t3-1-2LB]MCL2908023.1 flagellar type III secretion system protein FliQ [Shewanella fodinae]TCN81741.1 flagellar biosynthetic protein FliQ [Shewanella fodinae]GGZ12620.1 flagellar export apparatus protein FliQ [Shewanella fodinae]